MRIEDKKLKPRKAMKGIFLTIKNKKKTIGYSDGRKVGTSAIFTLSPIILVKP